MTPPIILRQDMEFQLVHQLVEAAVDWYGESEAPHHPAPAGKSWQKFILKLSQIADLRRK